MPTTPERTAGTELDGRAANTAVIRSFIDAWNTRDLDRFTALMGDHAVLHVGSVDIFCNPAGTRAIAEEWP